jgi:predicted outer membrane protein
MEVLMSVSLSIRFYVVGAGLACLLMGSAYAQQQTDERIESAQEGSAAAQEDIDDTESGQTDSARVDRPGPNRAVQKAERGELRQDQRRRGDRGLRAGRSDHQQVEQFLVGCLLQKNQNEIDAAQFAQQQSQNAEVKKFAQLLVEDHRQMVQQLQQLQQGRATQQGSGTGAGRRTAGQQRGGIQQLMAIDRAINERCAAALKEELQQKQGAEFDMAFVGSQISGHMQMVATLEVLSQQGPEQVQQLAEKALPKVQSHLDHAKQLKEQLKSGEQHSTNQSK